MKVLVDRLRELGWVEGQNLTIEYRSAEGDAKRLPGLAAQLVEAKPDVLVGGTGTLAPQALKAATTTIPVIFAAVGDPLGAKLVASLSRPEGNVTGLSSQVADLGGKRLEILRDLIPLQPAVAVLSNAPRRPLYRSAQGDRDRRRTAAVETVRASGDVGRSASKPVPCGAGGQGQRHDRSRRPLDL